MNQKPSQHDEEIFQRMLDSEKFILLGKMASGVAHEINNPIMIIQNYISLIIEEINDHGSIKISPEDEYYGFVQEILAECQRISKITKNLLNFSRSGSKNPQKTDIETVLLNVLKLVQPLIVKEQIQLKININTKHSQCAVRSDQIQQVFVNLLDNSIFGLKKKYPRFVSNRKEKYIEITLSTKTIQQENEAKNYVAVDFFDDGLGIEDMYHEKIFEPFFTTRKSKDNSSTGEQKARGLGLGLAYCQKVVQDHGGFIEFTSNYGEFARFTVNIPAFPIEISESNEGDNSEDLVIF